MEKPTFNLDQAQQLRRLMSTQDSAQDTAEPPTGPAPRMVVVSGAKGGVGTTTLAVNVAAALARRGKRTVLVDLELHRGDVAAMCGVTVHGDLSDVLANGRGLEETLHAGPAGMRILPGGWAPGESLVVRSELQQRLIRKLQGLGRSADVVVVDAGCGPSQMSRAFWRSADDAYVVTTPDAVSLMDAYATIKGLLDAHRRPRVQVVVNQVAHDAQGREVHRRLEQSCQRFLGLNALWAGAVPLDAMWTTVGAPTRPAVLQSPTCAACRAIDRLAAALAVPAPPRGRARVA